MCKNNVVKTTTKAALTQMINVINQRMEVNEKNATIAGETNNADLHCFSEKMVSAEELLKDDSAESNAASIALEPFSSVFQKDAYLLFRALCKLSMKGTNENTTGSGDNILLQNK